MPPGDAPLVSYESRVPDPRPPAPTHFCPECRVWMEVGFLWSSLWVEGEPKTSLLELIRAKPKRFRVDAYRCPECGLLESYAIHPPPEGPWGRIKRWRGW